MAEPGPDVATPADLGALDELWRPALSASELEAVFAGLAAWFAALGLAV